jgi:hypothetical protein
MLPDPSSHPDELFWVHTKTGHEYTVLHHGLREKDLCPVVIYQRRNEPHSPVWVRTADEFYDGRFVPNRTYLVYSGTEPVINTEFLNDWKADQDNQPDPDQEG